MHADEAPAPDSPGTLPYFAAADVQDNLMIAENDLERLQRLLEDACTSLFTSFHGAMGALPQDPATAEALADVRRHLTDATTALQFQDLAWQLITHTTTRLRHCADRLGHDLPGDPDEEGEVIVMDAPLRPNPVTQDEMDAGSIELF